MKRLFTAIFTVLTAFCLSATAFAAETVSGGAVMITVIRKKRKNVKG